MKTSSAFLNKLEVCGIIHCEVENHMNLSLEDKVILITGVLTSLQRNLVHYYAVTQAVLPFLRQSQGCIVNIASKVAITGQGGTSGYAAAKGAVLALTEDWAAELSAFGIRVNAVVPAEVMTPQYKRWVSQFPASEEKLRSIASKVTLGQRMTEPDEIAFMVVFLLSGKSAGVNGQSLFVDGGYAHLDRRLS